MFHKDMQLFHVNKLQSQTLEELLEIPLSFTCIAVDLLCTA